VKRWPLIALLAIPCAAQRPNCTAAPGFPQEGPLRTFNVETLFEYMNGNSEGYFLYGFKSMEGITCAKGDLKLIFDTSEFKDAESAYGMFTGNLDTREPVLNLAGGAQVTPRKAVFVKGKYYVEVAAEPEGDHAALLKDVIARFEKTFEGATAPPPQVAWFPAEGLMPGFPRLVPQSVLGLRMLKRGYLAQYGQGKAFVVTEASADEAKALFGQLKQRFTPNEALEAGEEAFSTQDRYLGRICIFRKGTHVGGWTNLKDGADPGSLAKALAAKL